ncbi:CHASE2 domain-containing protein [Azonexus sp. R2A61]|uniref:CHASE2 domain-containing protein n=1 Tax=Azonexus sp. R2A61 TaxID=2744443 RepID=UPI001F1E976F|nr:adenylate/guanylate cyclase domain-containing protein [Azonexus sp. R2A61]
MQRTRYWTLILPLLVTAMLIAGQWLAGAQLELLRNAVFDQYQRWSPRPSVDTPVRIVDIDEDSLQRLGQWPWPRTRLAELVDRLQQADAAAIAFDVMFAEADRTSPAAITELWQAGPALRRQLAHLPDHDAVFAASLARAPTVVGFSATRQQGAGRMPARKAALVNLGEPQRHWLPAFDGAVGSLPAFENAASGNGALSFVPDRDGIVRRVPLLVELPDGPAPSLTSEALRVAQGAPTLILRSAGHLQQLGGTRDNAGLGEVRIGELSLPTTPQGEFWVHYAPRDPTLNLPAWQVLDGSAPAERLAGHIVLVGSSAQGLMDLRFGPFGLMPGVEIHAQALQQMLSGHFLQRPSWAPGLEFLILAIGSLLIGIVALRVRASASALLGLALTLAVALLSWQAFVGEGLLLDPAWPIVGMTASFLLCSLAHHLLTEHEQRWLRSAFARYVSPNRVAHLLEHQDDMALGGRRQECSFVFTDLAGFTGLMESIDPADAVTRLNDYLDGMIAIAFRHEGTLDRIVGDALAIMFSAPIPQPDHRARALACALEMDAFASAYAHDLRQRGIAFGETRIGVHAGEVIVGNFGGHTMFDYRALGDPVNTAARLESANKYLGTRLCVSEAILAGVPDAPARPVGRLVLKGRQQALAVFEPERPTADPMRAPLTDYRTAYALLDDDPPAAAARFAELAGQWPADPLVRLHHERLQRGESGSRIVLAGK